MSRHRGRPRTWPGRSRNFRKLASYEFVGGLDAVQRPLKDELAKAIATARGGKGAGAMADELLKRDKQSHHLIGVVEQGEKAVFYDSGMWGVVAVPFDESGVDGRKQ